MNYFTEAELDRAARPMAEKVLEALADGRLDTVCALLTKMEIGHKPLHLLGVQWLARMVGYLRSRRGEAYLNDLLAEAGEFVMQPYASEFLRGGARDVSRELFRIWGYHVGATIVPRRETETELVFDLAPCGLGGTFALEGWPDQLPDLLAPCSDGTPILCHTCKALQHAFNRICGQTVWTTRINPTIPGACRMRFAKPAGQQDLWMDAAQRYALTRSRARQALEKVQAGDMDIAGLVNRQHHEWKPWHDLLVQFLACIQSCVYRKKGADALDDLLRQTYDPAFGMFYPAYEALDDISLLGMFVDLWHYHMADFTVREEDDRFVFILDPCGSGGRMYRSQMHKDHFKYGQGLPCLMRDPADINFNRRDFPIYCTHCASSNRDQFAGHPLIFVVDGHAQRDPRSPCIQYLYKKEAPRNVDPSLLAQVGKKTDASPVAE